MIVFTIQVIEIKPRTCTVDMRMDGSGSATDIEIQLAKGINVGIRTATNFMVQHTQGASGTILEGNDIEQFIKAALERAKR